MNDQNKMIRRTKTIVTHTTTRIAYDPGKQGVQSAVYVPREISAAVSNGRFKVSAQTDLKARNHFSHEAKKSLKKSYTLMLSTTVLIVVVSLVAIVLLVAL